MPKPNAIEEAEERIRIACTLMVRAEPDCLEEVTRHMAAAAETIRNSSLITSSDDPRLRTLASELRRAGRLLEGLDQWHRGLSGLRAVDDVAGYDSGGRLSDCAQRAAVLIHG